MKTTEKRVVLAMSGGVDSSVAAQLLLQQGFEVIGVFMRHGEETGQCDLDSDLPIVDLRQASKQGCCTARDALDARRVSDALGIPFYALNLEADFRRIVDYFVDEYSHGRTPNPCVMCNNWVKFGKLFDYADSVGAHYVATGHYAQLQTDDAGLPALVRGVDSTKDQSYVLFGIERHRLSRMLLPVGGFEKTKIREIASSIGLRVAEKKDSQEICFVESGKHPEFVRQRQDAAFGDRNGPIVTTDGRVVGEHPGIEGFTIGQRKGLGVAMGEPYFVVDIQAEERRIVIGKHHELARREIHGQRTNWLIAPPNAPFDCMAQIRYNSRAVPGRAFPLENNRFRFEFAEPVHGVAPGQAVVCYDQSRVLGGGWIE